MAKRNLKHDKGKIYLKILMLVSLFEDEGSLISNVDIYTVVGISDEERRRTYNLINDLQQRGVIKDCVENKLAGWRLTRLGKDLLHKTSSQLGVIIELIDTTCVQNEKDIL